MLESSLGIRVVLLLGPNVPLPPSAQLMQALTRIEVTNDAENGDGFQLTFAAGRSGPVDYDLLQGGELAPMTRAVIAVVFGVLPEVLIDGVVTHVQLSPGTSPGQAVLTVTGRDLTALMDLEERNESYENQPDFVIASRVLANYARYGIVPQPTPTTDVPIILERIPRQNETDLKFLQRLAARNGFKFYLEPVTFLVNNAVFGPESRVGFPQPAITLNLGAASNAKSLNFSLDALAATQTEASIVEPISKTRIPLPPLPSLRLPPLAAFGAPALRKTIERETSNQTPATAATRALASATNAADASSAEGELDGVRYGTALRARRLVGVRGAGLTHDGFWYVGKVTHTIMRGDYAERFSLRREGQGALLPVVRP